MFHLLHLWKITASLQKLNKIQQFRIVTEKALKVSTPAYKRTIQRVNLHSLFFLLTIYG